MMQSGHITHDQVLRSIELFGEKVLPRFAETPAMTPAPAAV